MVRTKQHHLGTGRQREIPRNGDLAAKRNYSLCWNFEHETCRATARTNFYLSSLRQSRHTRKVDKTCDRVGDHIHEEQMILPRPNVGNAKRAVTVSFAFGLRHWGCLPERQEPQTAIHGSRRVYESDPTTYLAARGGRLVPDSFWIAALQIH